MKHFLLSFYSLGHHGHNQEQQRCMQLRNLISVELCQWKPVTQNSQKKAQKRKGTKKGKINSSGNSKRTWEVIAAFCNTYSNLYYSVQLCLLPGLSIKTPPGIMVYHDMNRVPMILTWGWKGAYYNVEERSCIGEANWEDSSLQQLRTVSNVPLLCR